MNKVKILTLNSTITWLVVYFTWRQVGQVSFLVFVFMLDSNWSVADIAHSLSHPYAYYIMNSAFNPNYCLIYIQAHCQREGKRNEPKSPSKFWFNSKLIQNQKFRIDHQCSHVCMSATDISWWCSPPQDSVTFHSCLSWWCNTNED